MGSSTRSGWIPETPDNEPEVMRTFRAYQQGLSLMGEQGGIPALMAELTRINAAIQQQGQAALEQALTARLSQTIGSLDSVTLRSRPTASPLPGSERGRAGRDSRPFLQPSPSSLPSSRGGLGPAAARRIAAAQARRDDRG
jgi:hypothetical protein